MRLREEKTLMLVELVMLICITLSTVIVEISDGIISDWQTKTLIKMHKWNNLHSNFLNTKMESQFYGILQPWAKYMTLNEKNFELNLSDIDMKAKDISDRAKKSDVSVEDYIWENRVYYAEQYADYWNKCEEQTKSINRHLTSKPKFLWLKWATIKSLFNSLRIVSALIAAFLYIVLYKKISQRSEKKK